MLTLIHLHFYSIIEDVGNLTYVLSRLLGGERRINFEEVCKCIQVSEGYIAFKATT